MTSISRALHVVVKRAQQPLRPPDWVWRPGARRFERSLENIDRSVARLVRAGSCANPDSAMGLLLSAQRSGEIDEVQLRNEIVTLVVAGHETVAATMTWTWLLLAAHPSVMEEVREEVDALPAGPWSVGIVHQLQLTRAVIDECLRLYPPAWVISRRSVAADVVGGYEIPAATTIITSPYALHRDRRLWPDPLAFRPERFLGGDPERAIFLPFGAGPRLCIGREMARLEAPLVVAAMVRDFHVDLRPRGPIGKDFGVTLRPDVPIPARLARRA